MLAILIVSFAVKAAAQQPSSSGSPLAAEAGAAYERVSLRGPLWR